MNGLTRLLLSLSTAGVTMTLSSMEGWGQPGRVFDVQVVADGFCLEAAQKRKVEKYSEQLIIYGIKAITGCPEVNLGCHPNLEGLHGR